MVSDLLNLTGAQAEKNNKNNIAKRLTFTKFIKSPRSQDKTIPYLSLEGFSLDKFRAKLTPPLTKKYQGLKSGYIGVDFQVQNNNAKIKIYREMLVNYWLLSLTLLNILLMAVIAFSHLSKAKNKVEDQRLTKGLQLLQNKISILQDLSDKTDEQIRKWVHILEQKSSDIQNHVVKSDDKIAEIENALSKALDVSKIFYEQVPHSEMVERQKTGKYVMAAKLAHQGFSTDQISQKVDLSTAEIEMITKMNREELQFSEENLPAWVQTATNTAVQHEEKTQELTDFENQILQMQKMNTLHSATAFDMNKPDMSTMNQIKQEFTDSLANNSTQIPQTFLEDKTAMPAITKTESGKIVRPFEFRKIVK